MTRQCLPPRAIPASLCFEMPPGACDSHAHVFGPYAQFPLANQRSYTPDEQPVDAFIAHLNRLGLSRGVLVTASASGTDNAVVLDALRRHPQRLRGVVVPSPQIDVATLEAWHAAGVRGARVNLFRREGHPVYRNGIGLDVVESMAPQFRRLGWHLQVWIHAPDLPAMSDRLRRLELPLVIDHMGRMSTERGVSDAGFQYLCRMLERGEAWTKISGADRNTVGGVDYGDVDAFAQALLAANPSQVVWGTDWPHINYYETDQMPDDGRLTHLLARWMPDAALRHRVLVDNPARLYGFEG